MCFKLKQDPVSTKRKTGLTNFSSFLVWSGKGYHLWMWSLWGSQQPFSCVTTTRPNDQPSDPSLSLLLNREKAVFCNIMHNLSSYSYLCQVFCHNTRLSCVLWVFNQSRALSAIPGLLKCLLINGCIESKETFSTNQLSVIYQILVH